MDICLCVCVFQLTVCNLYCILIVLITVFVVAGTARERPAPSGTHQGRHCQEQTGISVSRAAETKQSCQGILCLLAIVFLRTKLVKVLHVYLLAVAFIRTKMSRYYMFVSNSVPQNKVVTVFHVCLLAVASSEQRCQGIACLLEVVFLRTKLTWYFMLVC